MLMPKRVKYRKQQRGRMRGKALRGADINFGEFGLMAMEPLAKDRSKLLACTGEMKRREGLIRIFRISIYTPPPELVWVKESNVNIG